MRDIEYEFEEKLKKDLATLIREYIKHLKNLPREEYEKLRQDSIDSLKRAGILNPDGTQKETIVTVEEDT